MLIGKSNKWEVETGHSSFLKIGEAYDVLILRR